MMYIYAVTNDVLYCNTVVQGASTDVQNNNQQTPLHLAVERQNIQVVRVSLQSAKSALSSMYKAHALFFYCMHLRCCGSAGHTIKAMRL